MGSARIHRIANRVHRGQLFVGGGLFVAHLQRVADVVEARGGDSVAVQAAWLHAAPAAGSGPVDLLGQGVPAGIVDVVDVLQQRSTEYPPAFTDRLLRNRRAALIRYAVLQDWHDNLAGAGRHGHWRAQHERLADALNLPRPAGNPLPTAADVDHLVGNPPAAGDHWGPTARALQRLGDPRALPTLLEAYHQVRGDDTRGCCRQAIRSAIFDIAADGRNAGAETVVDLTGRWWASSDAWEELVAVRARAATADPARHRALLSKLDTDRPAVATAAIKGLAGDAERGEVESLRRIVTRPEPGWRWARQAAARRLLQIGGPDARTALDQRYLSPADPPWRDDPGWLHRNRDQVTPLLIGKLGDRMWQFEACYALGELRAVQAVGSICRAAATVSSPVPHIEALGKIRSPDAVPTLLDQTAHTHPGRARPRATGTGPHR